MSHCDTNTKKKNKTINVNDRLCNKQYNFRVIEVSNKLCAVRTNIYGTIKNYDCYKIKVDRQQVIKIEKTPNFFINVKRGILIYKDGPIAINSNTPYLKYKTVPVGTFVKPEVNMMVTIMCRRYSVIECYIQAINNDTMTLCKINDTTPIIFTHIKNKWVNDLYTIDKIGGFERDFI